FSVTLPERTAYITLSLHDALPIWFVALAGWTLLQDHPRARHLELVTLAPHRLHQDAEVQLTASAHRVGVGRVGGFDPERDVALQDRKSTRLNSSHVKISYAVFCLK